ncbi:MAG: hypothetical protein HOM58_07590 [Rhodospirillaceae bacterium]|nr:hypothetical protein [Rhodospirillaceae bacterium]MBT7761043.1 hypothetical protein [Rhodospirillaceae bacterium]
MRKLVVLTGALVIVALIASVATFVRYRSFDACEWIALDMADRTSLPTAIWRGRVKAQFLLLGVTDPGAGDCILAWWEERADGAKNGH